METNENLVEVLNDLIKINNDRIEGYERAINEVEDMDLDLRGIFQNMANESRQNIDELSAEIINLGGEIETGTTNSGKIYRVWMDIKATFTGHNRTSVLESCEYGEDAAQEAYDDALATDTDLPVDIRQIIANQKAELLESHNLIKKYRDLHQAVN
ncbi:PA2169 family four-helix-bundle protein [Dyadobacter sp. LJ53]|uniref:ferritin-like domain-containing protein n=1 Tax=Dyadobacter chenwenxiniae TaxID=2906456 RepID=UPI001F1E5F65|nr:PA2169 family four-helix-bundle protein [Dyadobacter chenwenxiniae]MCF0053694.1 PA2169 family four-helix-bundle protein [Dyadobacter chenwenxiniae]